MDIFSKAKNSNSTWRKSSPKRETSNSYVLPALIKIKKRISKSVYSFFLEIFYEFSINLGQNYGVLAPLESNPYNLVGKKISKRIDFQISTSA